ncbi:MAG: hypothetical protein AMXMBFR64_54850 [Myxococcales bacterium]
MAEPESKELADETLTLLRRLGETTRSGQPHAGVRDSLKRLEALGALPPEAPAPDWVASPELEQALQLAGSAVGIHRANGSKAQKKGQRPYLWELLHRVADPAWKTTLQALFERITGVQYPRPPKRPPQDASPRPVVANAATPRRSVARPAPGPAPKRTPRPNRSRELTIYMDEVWDPDCSTQGVIAGVAVDGFPAPGALHGPGAFGLPPTADHLWRNSPKTADERLTAVLGNKELRPFVFPITAVTGRAQAQHDELVVRAIELLLILLDRWEPVTRGHRSVRVYLDQHAPHNAGDVWTDYVRGRLDGARGGASRWHVDHVGWCDGRAGLIPLADLLANPFHPAGKGRTRRDDLRRLPLYAELSLSLLPALQAVWSDETPPGQGRVSGRAEAIVDFFGLASGNLGDEVLGLIGTQVRRDDALARAVARELDERFRAKDRDLARLRRTCRAWEQVLPFDAPGVSVGVQLLARAVAIQEANHSGAPERARVHVEAYRSGLRRAAADAHREDVCFADLNVAVYHADRLEFERALRVANDVLGDPAFGALSPRSRGRALSSAGQYLAILGEADEADARFVQAISQFEAADLPDVERAGELAQTRSYRAINAMDAPLDGWRERLSELLGPLDAAARSFAQDAGGSAADYRHHVLLRACAGPPDDVLRSVSEVYLAERTAWKRGALQHPWELIHLYRGLLVARAGLGESVAAEWLDAALEVACAPDHGRVIRLIGAAIAVESERVVPGRYAERARGLIGRVREEWPEAAPRLDVIGAALDSPEASSSLLALPFTYR